MLNLQELRVLESIIDTTFGRSSIRDAGHAIKHKTMNHCDEGMVLEIRFETLLNVNSREGIQTAQNEFDKVSKKALEEEIKRVKSEFKAAAGRSLKSSEIFFRTF